MSAELSENFSLDEFLYSPTAIRMGRAVTVEPGSQEYANLSTLCQTILQPLRTKVGRKIIITSGYRPEWLNSAIGGAKHSAHTEGRAADIIADGITPRNLAFVIALSSLPFDQCILEFDEWVHVSIAAPGTTPRRQVLTASKQNGKTVYSGGL